MIYFVYHYVHYILLVEQKINKYFCLLTIILLLNTIMCNYNDLNVLMCNSCMNTPAYQQVAGHSVKSNLQILRYQHSSVLLYSLHNQLISNYSTRDEGAGAQLQYSTTFPMPIINNYIQNSGIHPDMNNIRCLFIYRPSIKSE